MKIALRLPIVCSLLAAAGPAAAQQPAVSQDELIRRTTRAVDSLAKADAFSGVVVIAKDGAPVFQRAWGDADREAKRANDVQTAFNIGSINKVFTASAIRQLAALGKLDLDSSLAKYLPDYPNQGVARRVTLRQIMQMRSGIGGDIFAAPPGKTRHAVRHNRDYIQLFASNPLEFEPGTKQQYSNAGYVVLGQVVERVSGQDYYRYVREHIYDPAGMTRSGSFPVDSLPPNTALGYTRGGDDDEAPPPNAPLRGNFETLPGRGSAAGGGYSTAGDLLRFLSAIRSGKIAGAPPSGLGVAGGAPGLNATVDGALPGDYDVIVLANMSPPTAMKVARMIREWLGATN